MFQMQSNTQFGSIGDGMDSVKQVLQVEIRINSGRYEEELRPHGLFRS